MWGGSILEPVGNIKFSYSGNGMGMSGLCAGQLEFDVYDDVNWYSDIMSDSLENAEVTVSCERLAFVSRTYFVASCTVSKNVCHFTCYDRISMTDKALEFSPGISDKIYIGNLIEFIARKCGFDSWATDSSVYSIGDDGYIPVQDILNVTCRTVLENIAEVLCGVWLCGAGNTLRLSCLGGISAYDAAFLSDDEHTEIDYQGRTKFSALTVTNTVTGEEYSFGGGSGMAVEISSPYANSRTAFDVWERLRNYTYIAWNCEKAILPYADEMTTFLIQVNGRYDEYSLLYATETVVAADSTGIYFSGGRPAQRAYNYHDYLERRKLSIGKTIGGAETGKGVEIKGNGRIVYRNLNKGGGSDG